MITIQLIQYPVFRYRHFEDTNDKPTPEEFVRYIIEKAAEIGPQNLDNHIKPMWASCPTCSIKFDLVGHLESYDEDASFIFNKMNLSVSQIKGG